MINLKTVIVNSDGEPMKQTFIKKETDDKGKEKQSSERRDVILKDIIKVALLKQSQTDAIDNEKGRINQKLVNLRYQLWKKIRDEDSIELDRKEIADEAYLPTLRIINSRAGY